MYYAYILQLRDHSYYHGYSANIHQRLTDHNRGLIHSTKNLRPVRLIFYAAFVSKDRALGFAFRNKRLI